VNSKVKALLFGLDGTATGQKQHPAELLPALQEYK
tara:strand:+ start:4068 stop:4172 length:105 start_codon:yes stop_codon:yes gene_type:complete